MNIIVLILLLLFANVIQVYTEDDTRSQLRVFIRDFLIHDNTRFCTVVTCWTKKDILLLNQLLMKENIRVSNIRPSVFLSNLDSGVIPYSTYILDHTCEFSKDILEKKGVASRFTAFQKWLVLTRPAENVTNFLEQLFSNVILRMDSDVKVVPWENSNQSDKILVYDVYNPGFDGGGKTTIGEHGYYDLNSSRFFFNKPNSFFDKRRNLEGVAVNRAIVALGDLGNQTPEEHLTNIKQPTVDIDLKFFYGLCEALQHAHGFGGQSIFARKLYGPNYIDDGVFSLVYNGSAELGCAGYFIQEDRIGLMKFFIPSLPFKTAFLFKNLGHHKLLDNQFAKPFSSELWTWCFISSVAYTAFLKVIFWIEHIFMGVAANYTWMTAILVTVGALTQRGYPAEPGTAAGRLLYLNLLLVCVLLYNYYTSLVISALLNARPEPLGSLRALRLSGMTASMEPANYMSMHLGKHADDPEVTRVFDALVLPPGLPGHYDPPAVGVARARAGGHAYHVQACQVYGLIERTWDLDDICSLEEIPVLKPSAVTLVTRMDSEYHGLFMTSLRMMETGGIIRRMTQKWVPRKPICLDSGLFVSAGVEDMFIAFLAYMVGITLSLLLLIIEVRWHNRKLRLGHRSLQFTE